MNFFPSINQKNAIKNMEWFCNITNNRIYFESKHDFDNYFKLLENKWNKKSNILKSVTSWKTTFKEINEKSKIKKEKYYSDYQPLKNYAIKYINRYYPTIKQLENQLYKKTNNPETINKVIEKILFMINEELMINTLIDNLKFRWKNINYISTKLYNKKFDTLLIKEKLELIKSEWTLLNKYNLENKVKIYKNKWKSKSEVAKKLIERDIDKELVYSIIENIYWKNSEEEILIRLIGKYKLKNIKKEKIIQRLILKWFSYNQIIKII